MHRIRITGLLILISLISFGQTTDSELLDRYEKCDSTLTDFEIMDLIFGFRDISKLKVNDGLLEDIQKLEKDSLFNDIESKCLKILKENPLNLTASYYYTISLLRLDKKENLKTSWDKTQMIYSAINRFGEGTENSPFYITDLNDAKAMIFLYWEEGTVVDSTLQTKKGIYNFYITNAKGENEKISFDFSETATIREVFFDYHRDFQYYLSESSKPESKYNYETLLNRFQKEDKSIKKNEIIALLIGFTNNQNYHPYKNADIERGIMGLVGDKDYKKALKQSEDLLKTNPLNFTALMEEGFSLMKIKNDSSYFPSVKSRMVVDAVLWSGTGSYLNPYFVLSPIDGQTIIRYIFGGSIGTMGSGDDSNGYFLDMLDMEKEGKETITLYFNIDHAMNNSEFKKQIDKALDKE